MVRSSATRERRLQELGGSLRDWRKASRLTASIVAERAGITRDTLRAIEEGAGSVRVENFFAVLEALGIDALVLAAVDPMNNERGRALAARGLPERVRR